MDERITVLRNLYEYLDAFDDQEAQWRVLEAFSSLEQPLILSELFFPRTMLVQDKVVLCGPLFPMSSKLLDDQNRPAELNDKYIDSFNWIDLDMVFPSASHNVRDGANLGAGNHLGAEVIKRIWQLYFGNEFPNRTFDVEIVGEDYGTTIGLQMREIKTGGTKQVNS